MSNPEPTIRVNVDPTNPGQFFACCGLLELADRLWDGAEGWFEVNQQSIAFAISAVSQDASLKVLLERVRAIGAELGEDSDSDDDDGDNGEDNDEPVVPIQIKKPLNLALDWWSDKALKPWAGTMRERPILRAMLGAIDESHDDPLNDSKVVFDPSMAAPQERKRKLKKREPFCFDSRTGGNINPLDVGFSPDKLKMKTKAFPTVEALCFIGLQRCRPRCTELQRIFEYYLWEVPLAASVAQAAVCGLLNQRRGFRFENAYRTDQRKHKGYLPATPFMR